MPTAEVFKMAKMLVVRQKNGLYWETVAKVELSTIQNGGTAVTQNERGWDVHVSVVEE